jgi:8-oxo-dGTP diphosphatase
MADRKKKRAEACVVAIIRNKFNQVLLTKRSRPPMAGMWHLPGGAVEFGEGHLDALVRELREEVGVEIGILDRRPLAACSTLYPEAGRHVVAIYFEARIASGTPKPLDGTVAVCWARFDRVRALNEQGVLLDSCRRALGDALEWKLPPLH